jgi:long-subunit fatty acid transport protein
MKKLMLGTTVLTFGAFGAQAGGLDRSGQDMGILFEAGNKFELTFGHARPSLDGVENGSTGTTNAIGNVAESFNVLSGALRYELSEQLAVAVIVDQPYGADILYPGVSTASALGGTSATVDSFAFTALARYKLNDALSVHGGLRYQEIESEVNLRGLAYGGLNGYRGEFDGDGAVGYVIGAAFERPEIALRVALTYNSKITHDLATRETISGTPVAAPSVTEVVAPESLNLDLQTGIAADTLLFGSVRYARYSDTRVAAAFFDAAVDPGTPGSSITDIEDSTDYEIGIGRRFNEKFSGSIAIGYQSSGSDSLVSPLSPNNGARYLSLGASYAVRSDITVSGGIRYTDFGNASPETGTPDVGRADFNDNSAISAGFKISYAF